MIERVNETKLPYFMKTNTFPDLINIILKKHSLKTAIFAKVDKVFWDKPLFKFMAHNFFGFQLMSSRSDKMIIQNCPISQRCLAAKETGG